MKKESKTFEYDELFALCMLCVARGVLIAVEEKYTNLDQATERVEKSVKELIALRWNNKIGKGNQD